MEAKYYLWGEKRWLADGAREETPKETEKCTQQPRNVTPIVLGTSDCTQLSKSTNEEDVDTNPITCQNDSQLENTQVILDVRESIEAMETMETHLTPSLPVTELQDKSTSAASILDANNSPILFQSLEKKLLTSLQDFITNALSSLKVHVEGEIQALRENLHVLELRITNLEQVDEDDQRSPCFVPISKDVDEAPITSVSAFSTQIGKKVEKNNRKLLKMQRDQNVIIVGLNESEMNTETMLMSFFKDKLNISPPPITYTKRLGSGVVSGIRGKQMTP